LRLGYEWIKYNNQKEKANSLCHWNHRKESSKI